MPEAPRGYRFVMEPQPSQVQGVAQDDSGAVQDSAPGPSGSQAGSAEGDNEGADALSAGLDRIDQALGLPSGTSRERFSKQAEGLVAMAKDGSVLPQEMYTYQDPAYAAYGRL